MDRPISMDIHIHGKPANISYFSAPHDGPAILYRESTAVMSPSTNSPGWKLDKNYTVYSC